MEQEPQHASPDLAALDAYEAGMAAFASATNRMRSYLTDRLKLLDDYGCSGDPDIHGRSKSIAAHIFFYKAETLERFQGQVPEQRENLTMQGGEDHALAARLRAGAGTIMQLHMSFAENARKNGQHMALLLEQDAALYARLKVGEVALLDAPPGPLDKLIAEATEMRELFLEAVLRFREAEQHHKGKRPQSGSHHLH